MAKGIFWLSVCCVFILCFTSSSNASEHEHIHIKLHLPEIIKKHTHLRTVVKHHFHPKKINKIHHHHYIDEALSTDTNPSFSFVPPSKSNFDLHYTGFGPSSHAISVWEPKTKVIDVKFRKPQSSSLSSLSSLLPPSTSSHSWDWDNDYSKVFKADKYMKSKLKDFTTSSSSHNLPPHYEFLNDIKFHQNLNKYKNDDNEFLMTEDTSLEHYPPNPLKYNNIFNSYNTLPNDFSDHWMTAAAATAADTIDSANSFESLNNESDDIGILSSPSSLPSLSSSSLSSNLDQSAYATTIHNNNYGFNKGRHSGMTTAAITDFDMLTGTAEGPITKSKYRLEPGMENFLEYNYSRRPQKQYWKKVKRNKPHVGTNNFRIRL